MRILISIVIALTGTCMTYKGCSDIPCYATANKMGFESDNGWFTGCMIKVNERWVPLSSYRSDSWE